MLQPFRISDRNYRQKIKRNHFSRLTKEANRLQKKTNRRRNENVKNQEKNNNEKLLQIT